MSITRAAFFLFQVRVLLISSMCVRVCAIIYDECHSVLKTKSRLSVTAAPRHTHTISATCFDKFGLSVSK